MISPDRSPCERIKYNVAHWHWLRPRWGMKIDYLRADGSVCAMLKRQCSCFSLAVSPVYIDLANEVSYMVNIIYIHSHDTGRYVQLMATPFPRRVFSSSLKRARFFAALFARSHLFSEPSLSPHGPVGSQLRHGRVGQPWMVPYPSQTHTCRYFWESKDIRRCARAYSTW